MIKRENVILVVVTMIGIVMMTIGTNNGESIPVPPPSVPVKICDVCK